MTPNDKVKLVAQAGATLLGALLVAFAAVVASLHLGDAQPLALAGTSFIAGGGLIAWNATPTVPVVNNVITPVQVEPVPPPPVPAV